MFALAINYLNGWSMAAADGARKQQAEWPPHPERVFMALAAAWFETREDSDEHRQERVALEWLEALPSPAVAASAATTRSVVTSYVPVNDSGFTKKKPSMTMMEKLKSEGLAYLPEHRVRQPRSFPVAIPHDPIVRLIWQDVDLENRHQPLERLATKVTHVGHSSSLVQMWLEQEVDIDANLEPVDGIAAHRLRVPSSGSFKRLASNGNHQRWIDFSDLKHEIDLEKEKLNSMPSHPPRKAWDSFPDAVLLADESITKQHPQYQAAKSGSKTAATRLVTDLVDETKLELVRSLIDRHREECAPVLVGVHAYEREGFNAIPGALIRLLSQNLDLPYATTVVQKNIVSHTGADGYSRLARQAAFSGDLNPKGNCLMVDDFIGQGGTLANLRGWVEKKGGTVIGAVGLAGKPYSAKLNPTKEQIHELRQKHGKDFEQWWKEFFGHTFDCLTQSEARYLTRSPNVDTIRNRLAEAMRKGGLRGTWRSRREQKRYLKEREEYFNNLFPNEPPPPTRPLPGKWQGYAAPPSPPGQIPQHSHFDPRIIVLGIASGRFSLCGTLKLTVALRGLLMSKCPRQPPPEWFSGHQADGKPAKQPHLALMPLPFVGSEHADGRIMGLALILPRELDEREAGACLERILRDATGLPQQHRLFDGDHFECNLALEVRERPPKSLLASPWTRPSRVWASVTPIVLDRHFDAADKADREKQEANNIRNMCQRIGLPQPSEVHVHPVSRIRGVPHARNFPKLVRKRDGGRMRHTHALIVFAEPVEGPVLLGAGRFRGYGACRPIELEQC